MEGFYVVFDRARKRIGFAVSACHGESTSEECGVSLVMFSLSAASIPRSLSVWKVVFIASG